MHTPGPSKRPASKLRGHSPQFYADKPHMDGSPIKLLVVDSDWQLGRKVTEYMSSRGFTVQTTNNLKEAREKVFYWMPKIILCDLILPDGSGLELLKAIKSHTGISESNPQFLIMSAHNQAANVKTALAEGVNDYIVKPFSMDHLLQRLYFHCRVLRTLPDIIDQEDLRFTSDEGRTLHLVHLLLKQALQPQELDQNLFKITQMLSLKTKSIRCSIIRYISETQGEVVASHDSPEAAGIQLDLAKYPEILNVKYDPRPLGIENLEQDANLGFIKKNLKSIDFNSMLVCPLFVRGQFYGVLSLKFSADKTSFNDREFRFIEVASQIISLALAQSAQAMAAAA